MDLTIAERVWELIGPREHMLADDIEKTCKITRDQLYNALSRIKGSLLEPGRQIYMRKGVVCHPPRHPRPKKSRIGGLELWTADMVREWT